MSRLKEIRKIRNLTQKELADLVGTTSVNISYLEIRRGLSEKWLDKLSKVLNCTKAQLLGEQSIEELGRSPEEIKNDKRNLIFNLRTKKGLSASELAKRVGVAASTIWAFENGKASISSELIQKIAEVLDVNLEYEIEKELPPPKIQLISDNPYPIIEKYLKYSVEIYDQVIRSNRHFEEEKAAILYEIYKVVYDFFENQHNQENDLNKIEVQAKAMKGVYDLLKSRGKYE